MTPWRKRLLYCLAVTPLLVIAFLWIRSYLPQDTYLFNRNGRLMLVFAEGSRSLSFTRSPDRSVNVEAQLNIARTDAQSHVSFWGLEFFAGPKPAPAPVPRSGRSGPGTPFTTPIPRQPVRGDYCAFIIPYPYLFIIVAAGSAWPIYLLRRKVCRLRTGCCQSCGYDLRASTDKCPECGSPIPTNDKGQLTKDNEPQTTNNKPQ